MNCLLDVIDDVVRVINNARRYRLCYFWKPPATAAERRKDEFSVAFSFEYCGEEITVAQYLTVSKSNYYFKTHVERNGKKSNVRYLQNILRRREETKEVK